MRRAAVAVSASVMLSACVSGLKSNQIEPQRYVLQASQAPVTAGTTGPAATRPAANGAVTVLLPEVAAGLDTERIAVLQPGQRLSYYAAARWADGLPKVLQAAVVDALRASGRFDDAQPEGAPFRAGTLLRIEVHDFQVDYSGGTPVAHVALRATLGRSADRSVIAAASADRRIPAAADRLQAVVDALQRGLAQALSQLIAALPGQAAP